MEGGIRPAGRGEIAQDVFANTATRRVPGEVSFADLLEGEVAKVQNFDEQYQQALEAYLLGADNQDEVVIAFRKKQFAFNTLLTIRNKLQDAFDELMRLRI